MDFDDIVIGSGLSALGALLGIVASEGRRVLVLTGSADNVFSYYDQQRSTPCSYQGGGGLGNFWHGVIPLGLHPRFGDCSNEAFTRLFSRFYPETDISDQLGTPMLFVPWKPIRPTGVIELLARQHGGRVTLRPESCLSVHLEDSHGRVTSASGELRGKRVWVAAGALRTPALLAATFGKQLNRGFADDHVICYVGQTEGKRVAKISYTGNGILFPATYGPGGALYTKRPAAFSYRKLDFGIEQRAIFGMPTGNIIRKLARRLSPGLLVEAFYNRFGLFAGAPMQSVYAQLVVENAYQVTDDAMFPLVPRKENILAATDAARATQPFMGLTHSRMKHIYLPGIHLHHTLDTVAAEKAGLNVPASPLQIVDASALRNIGPEHHSFKMMLSAFERARNCN